MNNKIIAIISVLILVAAGTFILFPKTGDAVVSPGADSLITLKVSIPCSGHAYLIKSTLIQVPGIVDVQFKSPNYFDVSYNSEEISSDKILSLELFKQYPAEIRK